MHKKLSFELLDIYKKVAYNGVVFYGSVYKPKYTVILFILYQSAKTSKETLYEESKTHLFFCLYEGI